jgi:hypothetical protein
MKLYNNIKGMAAKMQIDYEQITAEIEHRGEKGTAREDIIKAFVSQYLPDSFGIARGIIIDADDHQSNQQDVFVYDKSVTPKLWNTDNVSIVPIECVRVIVEVKSVLTTAELVKAVENVISVRSMKRTYLGGYNIPQYPFGLVFAYESQITLDKQIETIYEMLKESSIDHFPTLITTLNRGTISLADKNDLMPMTLFPNKDRVYAKHETTDIGNNLMLFYLMLITGLSLQNVFHTQPNMLEYATKSGFSNPTKTIPVEQTIGAKVNLDGKIVDLDKLREFQALMKDTTTEERKQPDFVQKLMTKLAEAIPDMLKDLAGER